MFIYYAHPMSWYNTPDEAADAAFIAQAGRVVNPNNSMFQDEVQQALKRKFPVMDVFAQYIRDVADVVVFRRFKDNKIGAGVAREILEAQIWGKKIWEIDGDINDLGIYKNVYVHTTDILTVVETRDRISKGQL